MPLTLVATVGSATANTYLTIAEGNDFADQMLGTLKWASSGEDLKAKALVMATRYLDELEYIGDRVTTTQALAWPRTEAACGDWSFSTTVIPKPVQQATFDVAELLLTDPTLLTGVSAGSAELIPGIPNSDLKRAKVDVLEVEFSTASSVPPRFILDVMPHLPKVLGCLCLSKPSSTSGTVRVLRA